MAARARTNRGRSARGNPSVGTRKPRRSTTTWRSRLPGPTIIGLFLVAVVVASIPYLIDVGELVSDVRDAFTRTFGLGILVLAGMLCGLGALLARREAIAPERQTRLLAGGAALGLYIWGGLGLNHADWTLGNVSFKEVSLGGNIGNAMVSSWFGILLWLACGVFALVMLAPSRSAWMVRTTPVAVRTSWEREYPHRTARTTWNIISGVSNGIASAVIWLARLGRRGEDDWDGNDSLIIGGPVRAGGAPVYEVPPEPLAYRGDPDAPRSPVSVGAAAQFLHEPAIERRKPVAPPPDGEPHEDAAVEDDPGDLLDDVYDTLDPELAPATAEPEADALNLDDEEEPSDVPQVRRLGPSWPLPAMDLFSLPKPSASQERDNAARARLIIDTLASFGVDASVAEINEGPTVTQFGVEPGWEVKYKDVPLKDENRKPIIAADGQPATRRVEVSRTRVRVNRITSLQNDLALALAAPSLRIEAPVPGRAMVGIEVPNDSATVVSIRGVMETAEFMAAARKSKLALPLGMGVTGSAIVADLAKMPHLLIAGATGSGKSVCMNAIVCGILKNATPEDVRFVMVDPKRVELTGYGQIPHLALSEVIVDPEKVVATLQAVVREMENRYKLFADVGVRNIESYNARPATLKRLPYWVVLIDELADLMMVAPFEVEKLLCRLAQLARATGIHLVVATQRPSVDVITGLIKANFPTRIAFAMTSVTDSRTVLDMGGAEKLLGRGDMLFSPTDAPKPIRIQGVYVSDEEVQRIVDFWTDERFAALAPENSDHLLRSALSELNGDDDDFELEMEDPIYAAARDLVLRHTRVSPSMLQRRLEIGDVKAQTIIERLYDEGIVGPREDGESRRVIAESPTGDD